MRGPETVQVKLSLFKMAEVSGTWRPNDEERIAAWKLYIELVTRVGIVPLENGLLREALSSLYSIFGTSREILRQHGPAVAEPKPSGELNFGYLCVAVLNYTLRPVLSYWHPLLEEWEMRKGVGVSRLEHERSWPRSDELRGVLDEVGLELRTFAEYLAQACNVPGLLNAVPTRDSR